ncbi:MAG: ASCH domain-containing protein [Candidatus Brocadiia bacterium]
MIRFAERQVQNILTGRKKVTRIGVPSPWKVGEVVTACKLVNGIDQPFAYLKLVSVRQHKLKEITDADAKLEGYDNRTEFLKVWLELHEASQDTDDVWALEFEFVRAVDKHDLNLIG